MHQCFTTSVIKMIGSCKFGLFKSYKNVKSKAGKKQALVDAAFTVSSEAFEVWGMGE